MAEHLNFKGLSTCGDESQVTSEVKGEVRYNSNNAWIVNLNNGNVNNNNTYNRYYVCGASELEFIIDDWLEAERECFKNKHCSLNASRLHYYPSKVWRLAAKVMSGQFKPLRSYCFPLSYPVLREIFAAYPSDRIVHHYVAPFISSVAEAVHTANGDVSHGNRKGHSAYTYAMQVQENMKKVGKNGYVVKRDIRGFFMSIPREDAYRTLERYARRYYKGRDIEEKLAICKVLILSNPTDNCLKVGDISLWEKIPRNKSLFYAKEGCGLPIGNFYSQLIANLYLAEWDEYLLSKGVLVSRFVDDTTYVADSLDKVRILYDETNRKARELKLEVHPNKYYVQPIHRGVSTCGYTIKGNRIYLNNRSINACHRAISECPASEYGATEIFKTVNSYMGFLRHCTERNNERRIADMVLEKFGEWLVFDMKDGHFICKVKHQYQPRIKSKLFYNNLINQCNESWKIHQRGFRFS